MVNDSYLEAPPQGGGVGGMTVLPLKLPMAQSNLSNSHVQGLGAAGTPGGPSQHKWQTQATSDSPAEVTVAIKGCRTTNTPQSGKPR